MPLKINISLETGVGGKMLDTVWIARLEPLETGKTEYLYGISERIHPWKTLASFHHERGSGHLVLTAKALNVLVESGIVRNENTVPVNDRLDRIRLDGLEDHLALGLTPDEYL